MDSAGRTFDSYGGNTVWNSKLEADTRVDKDGWSVELAIPFSDLGGAPGPGSEWRMNVMRNRQKRAGTAATEYSGCFPHFQRNFHLPAMFGAMVFE